ncbi:MAG: DNA-protecting protein DprA, partial [Elusimicrobia bacterium]|nr:DNA-protecting protein DprA [Candidatus Obscuribacterium magneticum]
MNNVINEQRFPKELDDWKKKSNTLWYLGDLRLLDKPKVSVIGTRGVSQQGVTRTKNITKILIDNGFVVVSGMAKGVDTVAHKAALEMNGSTIAVMGTPINKCYPRENESLKKEIAK